MNSPVTPITTAALTLDENASVCTKLKTLLSAGEVLKDLVSYLFDNNGAPTDGFIAALGAKLMPTGSMIFWLGQTLPTGFLLANGQAVSRSTYVSLFQVFGTSYGAGDLTTTFNLPDMSDRLPMGASGSKPVGSPGGANSVTLDATKIPKLTPTLISPSDSLIVGDPTGSFGLDSSGNIEKAGATAAFYVGNPDPAAIDITPSYRAGQWIIRA